MANSKIVRLLIGHTSEAIGAPEGHDVQAQMTSSQRYFEDIQAYLVALAGLAHMIEVSKSGNSTVYESEHTVRLDCAREKSSWYWAPSQTLRMLAFNSAPESLKIEKIEGPAEGGAGELKLGAFGKLLESFGQALGTNFYERHRDEIAEKFGPDPNGSWPAVWNFARAVRNAMSHRGEIHFRSQEAPKVAWKGLSYGPGENGRRVFHHDLWPGDLFDLLIEMDSHL